MSEREHGPSGEAGGPEDRILHWAEVREMTGLSRSTTWRLQRAGEFPRSITLSPGRVGWWESELAEWRKTRGARRYRPPAAPRLPGMARRTRPREPEGLVQTTSDQGETGRGRAAAGGDPMAIPAARSRKRRASPVHPAQIDFGF